MTDETKTVQEMIEYLQRIPNKNMMFMSVTGQSKWIPCEERLPSEGQGVLVTVDDNKYKIKVGSCLFNNGVFHSLYNDLDVIAWMPLPEPYMKGEKK